MAKRREDREMSLPVVGMIMVAVLGAVVTAASFGIEPYWPLPKGVDPYFGADVGFIWGGIAGAVVGLIIGYLTDDSHFPEDISY